MDDLRFRFINFKEKLTSFQFRKMWLLDSFDKKSQEKIIMAEMPDFETYQTNKAKKDKERVSITPELTFLYIEPFITKEQEQHLFRKYNFIKYKFKKIINKANSKSLSEVVKTLDNYYREMNTIKQQLILSHTRLVMNITKKMNVQMDGLSAGCLGLTTAVDYFDFRRNIKFISYCYLVIKDHVRKYKSYNIKHQLISNLDKAFEPSLVDNRHPDIESQAQDNEIKEKINDGLRFMNYRQREIINHWFGLNGRTQLNLEQIGHKFNITRERVRQIKTLGLDRLREFDAFLQCQKQEYNNTDSDKEFIRNYVAEGTDDGEKKHRRRECVEQFRS